MNHLSLSTDQVAAFVELARQGSLRAAAETLLITEQGVRNRLLALEQRLKTQLYHKSRGIRRSTPLTPEGHQFLPHAIAFLERAVELGEMFRDELPAGEVHVVASQYLIGYVLIDAVQRFHSARPSIRVRLSARRESDIERLLREDPDISFGVAAPYEASPELTYQHLFEMDWSVITPRSHPLASRQQVKLADVTPYPLILYERGSTGRQHVLEAFHQVGLSPQVEMEATNTDLIVRMVEAGLGISIVPLLQSGIVTQGHKIGLCSLGKQIRPIHSGILTRKNERPSAASREFIEFIRSEGIEASQPRGKRKTRRAR